MVPHDSRREAKGRANNGKMIDAQTYLEHARRDGNLIAQIAAGRLDEPVPTCPGNTVGSLLLHTAGVCLFWTGALQQKRLPDHPDWTTLPKNYTATGDPRWDAVTPARGPGRRPPAK